MKIGFVLDDSLDKTDGVQQYVMSLAHWYEQEGHQVHYLVGETHRTDLKNIHSLSRNFQVHFNQNRMSTPLPADRKVIQQLLDKQQFDVLHVQMPYSPLLAGRIIKAASAKTVIVGTFHIIPFSFIERVATRLLAVWSRKTIKRLDKAYAVSKPAQCFQKITYKLTSDIIPNPVNLNLYKNGREIKRYKDGKINIVFLGRLVERKGCGYLLQVLENLHQKHQLDRVRVLICGKGPLENELKDFVRKKHLGSIVHFVGYVTEKEKIQYLKTADIVVLPSTGGESFGIVLTEAMAAGSAVVIAGNNVGYKHVMAGSKNQLVNPKNIKSFSKILRHFIINGRARHQAVQWQQEHVKQFDVRMVGAQLLDDYRQLIAKRVDN